ncbi:MAG: hypothetical protein E6H07_01705 [Bacteroidetes bacterium]|nr:MAG: hypothetical protein E6H07_01705 [Bacteroidota bacterium]
MKPLQSLISASMVIAIAFTSCNDKKEEGSTTTVTPVEQSNADNSQQKLEANKKLVTEFYQAFFGDKDSTSIDKYVGDNIIQHSPLFEDGKIAFKDALRPFYTNPNITKKTVDIKHIAAEGDKVWVMVKDVAPNGKEFARLDIFKIENGKITEHWVVEQAVPKESANKNTMF